jgi:putative flippase GtrA
MIKRPLPFVTPRLLRRAIRFGLTGLLVTALHVLLAILFIKFVAAMLLLANGVAFAAATLTSYVLNTRWSFCSGIDGRTFRRFMAVSAAGFLMAMLVAYLAQEAGADNLASIGAVALTVPPLTFLLHNCWTYRQSTVAV